MTCALLPLSPNEAVGRVSDPFSLSGLASPDGNTFLVHREAETADLVMLENFR